MILTALFFTICILYFVNPSYGYSSLPPLTSRRLRTKARQNDKIRLQLLLADLDPTEVFIPPEVGPEIYIGTIVAILPIVYAAFEFNSRIQTQRNCLLCGGTGLVKVNATTLLSQHIYYHLIT